MIVVGPTHMGQTDIAPMPKNESYKKSLVIVSMTLCSDLLCYFEEYEKPQALRLKKRKQEERRFTTYSSMNKIST